MAGQFRSSVWDPILILSQIAAIQGAFYVSLGFWIFIMDYIVGTYKSLDQIFGYEELQFKEFHGRMIMGAFVLNAFTGAIALWYVVQRTKQCLDFTATTHLFHFIVCWAYNGAFPTTISWWLVNIVDIIIMTVLGEFLCMRSEMKAIPLSMVPKVDL